MRLWCWFRLLCASADEPFKGSKRSNCSRRSNSASRYSTLQGTVVTDLYDYFRANSRRASVG